MAQAGNSYIITLKKAHLEWGTHRYTNSRGKVYGEGYIPIPIHVAKSYNLYNANGTNYNDIYGQNLFKCTSADGLFTSDLKSQGSRRSGDIYAKQFSGDGNLQALGYWFSQMGAQVGNRVKVTWRSFDSIEIELI